MLRKVLCNYEFIYEGITHKAYGEYLGDTSNVNSAKTKDYSSEVACKALKMGTEELAKMLNMKYWDISKFKLEQSGFKFVQIEIFFYPKP